MKILVLNAIMFTPEHGVIPRVSSIKDTLIYGMCQGFKSLGHDVTLVCAEDYRPQPEETDYEFTVLWMKSKFTKFCPPAVLPYSAALKHFLREHGREYDMVLSSDTFTFASYFAARIVPEKLVIWQELSFHQHKFHRLPSKFWHNVIARHLMKRTHVVVPRSPAAGEFMRKYLPQTSTEFVEHGIDTDKFQVSELKTRTLISSSQLIERKRVDGIIRRFAELHRVPGYEDIRLIIAGRGPEEANLRAVAEQEGVADMVDFVGFLPRHELNIYVRHALAFLVNTRQDLNVVSIPESIVSGTPILTNTVPSSTPYIIENGLGIAKDDWGVAELRQIIDENEAYTSRCKTYRERLSLRASAQALIRFMG